MHDMKKVPDANVGEDDDDWEMVEDSDEAGQGDNVGEDIGGDAGQGDNVGEAIGGGEAGQGDNAGEAIGGEDPFTLVMLLALEVGCIVSFSSDSVLFILKPSS
jgi:hypothetical protein